VGLIATLAVGFGLALFLGFVAARMKLPALVGYLVAGILLGPATPGFVANTAAAPELAEVGVMLLMFGVGLHFSVEDLMAVRKIAVPGALIRTAVVTAIGAAIAALWGWPLAAGLVFGICLSVASTVVALKALETEGETDTANGRITIGWLVVEDLAMVLVLVLVPALAPRLHGATMSSAAASPTLAILKTLAQVGGFVAFMLVVGRRLFPWLLWQVAKTGSRELFTLCVVAAAVGIAYGSAQLFGVSFALGAFFAGMVLRESEFSARAAEQTLPLQDAFAVLFFVSVGMLFDPRVLLDEPLRVLTVVAVVMLVKTAVAVGLVLALRYPVRTALLVPAALGQVGEFSFILAGLGVTLGVLPKEGQDLVLAGALISIAANPLLFRLVRPLQRRLQRFPRLAALELAANPLAELPMTTDARYLSNQVVLVGWGRVGKHIAETLTRERVPFVVAETNREFVQALRSRGVPAIWGDATEAEVLIQTHVKDARALVIAMPETVHVRKMVEVARTLNPGIQVLVRSHNVEEAELLEKDGAGTVFVGERELARAMSALVLEIVAKPRQTSG
jgi:CPA2 family monovalent cation:H+ antiporter-2